MYNLYIVLLSIFSIVVILQLYFYWVVFSRFAFHTNTKAPLTDNQLPPVSVVICAHNQHHNLKNFLPLILTQEYPDFEVIVVNDLSDDETKEFIDELILQYPLLRMINLTQRLNFFTGKKFPLSLGIKSANHEHLILTDADCYPTDKHWIKTIMQQYTPETDIVLGYGKYEKRKSLLNLFIRYETLRTAMQYFAYALLKKPYMGVGRNLSYKKSLFFNSGGFVSHYNVASGDDDLFINKVATKKNTRIEYAPQSHTVSIPETSLGSWIRQKSRHISAGKFYKNADKWRLGAFFLSRLLLYPLTIALFILTAKGHGEHLLSGNTIIYLLIGVVLLLVTSQIVISQKCAAKLQENRLGLLAPLLDFGLLIFEFIFFLNNGIRKKQSW